MVSSPDDDDHYDRRNQRRRVDSAPLPVRVRRQLLSIADSPLRRWNEEVQSIAQMVAENYDDENLRTTFLDLVMQLLVEQPLKTPFVAAVVLVINTLKPELVDEVLARLAQATESKISLGEWRDVKLYLKFLACLQACLEGDGLFPVLEELFSRAADLQTASSDDVSHATGQIGYHWLTIVDHWNGARQDHSPNDPLHYGGCARELQTKGCGPDGQD